MQKRDARCIGRDRYLPFGAIFDLAQVEALWSKGRGATRAVAGASLTAKLRMVYGVSDVTSSPLVTVAAPSGCSCPLICVFYT